MIEQGEVREGEGEKKNKKKGEKTRNTSARIGSLAGNREGGEISWEHQHFLIFWFVVITFDYTFKGYATCSLAAVLRLDRSHNLGCDKFSYLIQLSVYVIYQPCYEMNSLQYYGRLLSEKK